MKNNQEQRTRFVPEDLEEVDAEVSRLRYLTRSLALVRNSPNCELRDKVEMQILERMKSSISEDRTTSLSTELEDALTKIRDLQLEKTNLEHDIQKLSQEVTVSSSPTPEVTSCVPKVLIAILITFLLTWLIF